MPMHNTQPGSAHPITLHELHDFIDVGKGQARSPYRRRRNRSRCGPSAHRPAPRRGTTTLGTSPTHSYNVCGDSRYGAVRYMHLPRLIEIEQRRAEAVHKAIARGEHAVIEQQPAFARLDRRRPGPDLGGLPAADRLHHKAMLAPVDQIRAFAVEDVAKGRVPGIAGAAEHGVLAVDLAREQHAVAVVRQEGILQSDGTFQNRSCSRGQSWGRDSRCTTTRSSDLRSSTRADRSDTRISITSGSPANSIGLGSISQWIASRLKPRWMFIVRVLSSQRNTPAKPSLNGTTALLKMLLEVGIASRGIIGLALYRHTTSLLVAGRSSHGRCGKG